MTGSVPDRPLLAPWYRLVETDDRLLLEYGQSVVALEGAAVVTLLPVLLPLLDGTRTPDELVERLGAATRPAIEHALQTLAANGLLVAGPDAGPDLRATSHAFAAAYNITPAAATARLAAAVVSVVGEAVAGLEIARLLRTAGIAEVRRCDWDDGSQPDLVVVAPAAHEVGLLAAWNRTALANGTNWLPLQPFDGRVAAVGPLVIPGETCCYECLALRRSANLAYGEDLTQIEAEPIAALADPAFDALIVGLSAHVALRWIVGHDRTIPGVLFAIEPQPLPTIADHSVLRVPRCPACSHRERLAPVLPWHAVEAA